MGAAFALDQAVREFVTHVRNDGFTDFLDTVSDFAGDETQVLMLMGSVVALGLVSGEDWILEMGLTAFEATVFAFAIVTALKFTTGRTRPEDTRDSMDFEGPGGDRSFPSERVIQVAPMVAVYAAYVDRWWFDVIAWTFIGIVCYQRMNDDKHWFSDVMMSSIIGYFVGRALVDLRKNPDVRIIPWASLDGGGLAIEFAP
jgi:hypothetical protein